MTAGIILILAGILLVIYPPLLSIIVAALLIFTGAMLISVARFERVITSYSIHYTKLYDNQQDTGKYQDNSSSHVMLRLR